MSQAIIGVRTPGASHKRVNKECQDYLDSREFKDGTFILAVADGHGSATSPFSSDGSKRATEAFKKVLSDLHNEYENSPEAFMTYLNREGDTRVAFEICKLWQEKVLSTHKQYRREVPMTEDNNVDEKAIWKLYGSTLLGLMISPTFIFAIQIGDGDIAFVDLKGFNKVVEGEKLLGVSTYSLSDPNAWQKAVTTVMSWNVGNEIPSAFFLTTDGFANSFKSDEAYEKTICEYYSALNEYGPKAIKNTLRKWLYETSEGGCGDDISMMICYNYDNDAIFSPVPEDDGD